MVNSRLGRPTYTEADRDRFLSGIEEAISLAPTRPNIYVETGTLYGDRIEWVKLNFDRICTIELSDELHNRACKRFRDDHWIVCWHGNSAEVLKKHFISEPDPIFFLLDAHHCRQGVDNEDRQYVAESFPLWGELKAISMRSGTTDIVWVDDRHNHNRDATWLNSRKKDKGWIDVTTDSLLHAMSGRNLVAAKPINNGFVMVVN